MRFAGLVLAIDLTRAERWDEIPTRHTQLSVRSLPMGGVGLGLAVHF